MPEAVHAALVGRIVEDLAVDLVHDHTLAGPLLARGRTCPTVVTAHGPVDGEPGLYYHALDDCVELVAISEAQRAKAPLLPWVATVTNAIRVESFPFHHEKEEFALFLGRFHPEKAPHLAIEAARDARLSIVLAGKCAEPVEREYFTRDNRASVPMSSSSAPPTRSKRGTFWLERGACCSRSSGTSPSDLS